MNEDVSLQPPEGTSTSEDTPVESSEETNTSEVAPVDFSEETNASEVLLSILLRRRVLVKLPQRSHLRSTNASEAAPEDTSTSEVGSLRRRALANLLLLNYRKRRAQAKSSL